MTAKIDSIEISVGFHKLNLTLDEAKALLSTLQETLGEKPAFPYVIERVIDRTSPWISPSIPMWQSSPVRIGEFTCLAAGTQS